MYQFYYADAAKVKKQPRYDKSVTSEYEITAVRPTMWEEHCLECSAPVCLPYMVSHTNKCIDGRGEDYLNRTFTEIADAMGCDSVESMCERFDSIYQSLSFQKASYTEEDITALTYSVNPVRLKNHPIALDLETIESLYRQILE